MSNPTEFWYEEDAGPLVRLYAIARGRGGAHRHNVDVATLVVDIGHGTAVPRRDPEYAAIVGLCKTPVAVAEVAARVGLPLNLTKILIGDLVEDGRLELRPTRTVAGRAHDVEFLRTVLAGIRAM